MPPELRIIKEEEKETEEFDYNSLPAPPESLSHEGRMIWWKLAKELEFKGRLSESVKDILESYCIVKSHAIELDKMIQTDGKIIGGKIHPMWKPMIEAFSQSKHLFAEIAFIRKETLNLNKEIEEEKSEWDKSLLA